MTKKFCDYCEKVIVKMYWLISTDEGQTCEFCCKDCLKEWVKRNL